MRVLGVDPGLTRCGIGVVDSRQGRRADLVAVGVATSSTDLSVDVRLLRISTELDRWMDLHVPDVVAVERVFAQHNVSTVMGTAQVAGLAMVAAARRGVPVAMHTPSEVKAAVTGSGRAGKEQVQKMVASILGLAEVPRPADAADALAIAICQLWRPAALMDRAERLELTPAQRAWAAAEQAARRAKGTR
ncbi:crossover junction endodeoxyribonuclease RuvC [Sanguibacter suaedae]|uniref:Crossover junction endodeoxyribonuclease RuvC n=1 Tax=Sanguibacter suaedae TaxID=2795737 RepID=A0A934IE70_9MICO|nr:crossover junction endodeoxyribonuclease RuvC [Sanguibacter suaedae]MBI9115314.1 crossover junction endodeoxyribonuclease RuvC [Sanguibacter suaedae]